jgi:hypothetical protein
MKATTYKCEVCNNPKVKIDNSGKHVKAPYSLVAFCTICRVVRNFIQKI